MRAGARDAVFNMALQRSRSGAPFICASGQSDKFIHHLNLKQTRKTQNELSDGHLLQITKSPG